MSVNRRELFPILAGAALGAPGAEAQHLHSKMTPVLATDQYKLRYFSEAEHKTLARLADIILPGAAEARVANYLDLVVSYAPAPVQQRWRDGVAGVGTGADVERAVAAMAEGEERPTTSAHQFFILLKGAVVEGYRLSPAGMEWMGWKGHPGGLYPGCTDTHEA